MRITRHEVGNYRVERTGLLQIARQELPIELAARHIIGLHKITHRESELVVVEEQVLAIQRDAQIFVYLVTHTDDEALEVQWILPHIVVWQ